MAKKNVCPIGGQAVLEGVMMRGKTSYATAVRTSEGNIVVESVRIPEPKKWNKIPIIRGVLNFLSMMIVGTKILMRSAEVFGEQLEAEQPTKFEKWLSKKMHIDIMTIAMILGVTLGLAMSIGLFFVLPQLVVSGIELLGVSFPPIVFNLIEGIVRVLIFMLYLIAVRLMKEIKRVFMYHGAEHKVISCYEQGLELTPENAQLQSTKHDRCGTNFIVIVMLVSVIVFSLTGWTANPNYPQAINVLIRVGIRLALLPLVAGVSYEVLKLLAKYDNPIVKVFKAPGLLVQKLTTVEPTIDMLEVAIKAFLTVQKLDASPDAPTEKFIIKKDASKLRADLEGYLSKTEEGNIIAEWIIAEVADVKRSELTLLKYVNEEQYKKAVEYAKKVAEGNPLQYVLGNTNFFGYPIKVDERALIPRAETELLVEETIKYINQDSKVIDVCTGSGAIAIALSKEKDIEVTATDISEDALSLAKENALANKAKVTFLRSDMFEGILDKYDVMVINPPYISLEEIKKLSKDVLKEPYSALYGGEDGLDYYRIIAAKGTQLLNDDGVIIMEIGYAQADAIKEIFEGYNVSIHKDYNEKDRIAVVRG